MVWSIGIYGVAGRRNGSFEAKYRYFERDEAAGENARKHSGYTTVSTFSLANKVAAEVAVLQPK